MIPLCSVMKRSKEKSPIGLLSDTTTPLSDALIHTLTCYNHVTKHTY